MKAIVIYSNPSSALIGIRGLLTRRSLKVKKSKISTEAKRKEKFMSVDHEVGQEEEKEKKKKFLISFQLWLQSYI